jgi:hypothetical protein
MLHIFAMVVKCFLAVFTSISDACFKCFICLFLYVATIAYECFKSRSGVPHGMCWEATDDADDIRGDIGPLLVRSLTSPTR